MARTASQRTLLVAGLAIVAAIVVRVALRASDEEPAPAPVAREPQPAPAPLPPPAAAPPASADLRDGGPLHPEGHGHATAEPPPPGQVPPPPEEMTEDPSANPPIEPEKPQTPEWRLEKTARLVDLIEQRLTRLERRLREAHARGDAAAVEETRILLERSRRRRGELRQEMEALREQIRADGGTPPALPGGP